ncbi:MAG: serine hydrolase, partial [Deinococcus sp.]
MRPEGLSLGERLRSQGYPGEVALVVQDARSGATLYQEQPQRSFPAASTIKVPLLVMALEACQAGRLSLEARLTLDAADRVPGSGVLHELGTGLQPSLRDLLTLMVVVSDNTATNLLIGRLGLGAAQGWLEERLPGTRLVGLLQQPPALQNEAQRRGERNATCARDQVGLLGRLYRGELLDPFHGGLALEI